jgi:hypothetical protein
MLLAIEVVAAHSQGAVDSGPELPPGIDWEHLLLQGISSSGDLRVLFDVVVWTSSQCWNPKGSVRRAGSS